MEALETWIFWGPLCSGIFLFQKAEPAPLNPCPGILSRKPAVTLGTRKVFGKNDGLRRIGGGGRLSHIRGHPLVKSTRGILAVPSPLFSSRIIIFKK